MDISPELLREKFNEIEALDAQLDAALGSETAGKVKLGRDLSKEHEAEWKTLGDQIVTKVSAVDDPAVLAGVFTGIISAMNEQFKESVDQYLTEQVKENKQNRAEISPEEIEVLKQARAKGGEQYKALRGMLELFGEDVSDIPEPKKRTGARGPRGPRVLQGYDFYIDGKLRTKEQNSLSSVANTVTSDKLGWKTPELREFITSQGIDLEDPPEEFSVELPDPINKTLTAKRREITDDDVDDEELDDEELEDEDEENGEESE